MHNAPKKVISVFLLLLVAMPFFILTFSVVKLAVIKSEMLQALKYEPLQTTTVSENDLKWVIPGREVLIKGDLFDVKSFKQIKGNVELTGLYDRNEEMLQEHLMKLLHQKQQGNSAASIALVNLLLQTLFTERTASCRNNITVIFLKENRYTFSENLAFANSDILIPPPKG